MRVKEGLVWIASVLACEVGLSLGNHARDSSTPFLELKRLVIVGCEVVELQGNGVMFRTYHSSNSPHSAI